MNMTRRASPCDERLGAGGSGEAGGLSGLRTTKTCKEGMGGRERTFFHLLARPETGAIPEPVWQFD